MPDTKQCHVRGCRFAYGHVTMVHKCGTCGKTGHGQLECREKAKIRALKDEHAEDAMPPGFGCQAHLPARMGPIGHLTVCDTAGARLLLQPPLHPGAGECSTAHRG
jgi:hypothetical protein